MSDKEGNRMDRDRFEYLLSAYGADFARWPAEERAAAAEFAAASAEELSTLIAEARSLDDALEAARRADAAIDSSALEANILAAAPRLGAGRVDRRALLALAACAVFGVLLGYGGGRLAPQGSSVEDYFAVAFEAPHMAQGDEG